jgi:hypothetical protein
MLTEHTKHSWMNLWKSRVFFFFFNIWMFLVFYFLSLQTYIMFVVVVVVVVAVDWHWSNFSEPISMRKEGAFAILASTWSFSRKYPKCTRAGRSTSKKFTWGRKKRKATQSRSRSGCRIVIWTVIIARFEIAVIVAPATQFWMRICSLSLNHLILEI